MEGVTWIAKGGNRRYGVWTVAGLPADLGGEVRTAVDIRKWNRPGVIARPGVPVGVVCARAAVVEATVGARSVAHGRDVRPADRALPDHFGRSPLRRRMVCRTRLFTHFGDARADDPAFRNRFFSMRASFVP